MIMQTFNHMGGGRGLLIKAHKAQLLCPHISRNGGEG